MELDTIVVSDALDFLKSLPDASVDLFVTSPPYDALRTYNGYSWNFEAIATESYRVLKPGGVLVWVVGDATVNGSETLTSMRQALYFVDAVGYRMHDTMYWHKDGNPSIQSNRYMQVVEYMFVLSKGAPKVSNLEMQPTKYGHGSGGFRSDGSKLIEFKYETKKPERVMDNIWYITSGFNKTTKDVDAYQHPAMFPEKLAERHILTWTKPGDIVGDFFMGSGTTAKMARNTGRHYIGCDLSQEYVNLARARLAQPYTPSLFDQLPEASESQPTQESLF